MIKLMLVDDSATILTLIEKIINTDVNFDTQITSFLDSSLAKEQFLEINPDFVITDIEMPHVDGFQLIEYIKSIKNTPILAMSSSSIKSESTSTLLYCTKLLGADYVILKNEIPNKLSSLLTEAIISHCT